jgi:hypothetical protein
VSSDRPSNGEGRVEIFCLGKAAINPYPLPMKNKEKHWTAIDLEALTFS